MTGTAREVAAELWSVYRRKVVTIPTHRPSRRTRGADRMYVTAERKWAEVVRTVRALNEQGRPVLVGTRSVAASERLGRELARAGLAHRVLNARQDQQEAGIIAQAGELRRITVATNMAGRGTDIRLAPRVVELGGLHVIATERHEARRIDRQLFGRAGRQGDPGSSEAILSLEDELSRDFYAAWLLRFVARFTGPDAAIRSWLATLLVAAAQRAAERKHAGLRRELLKVDERLEDMLAFGGRPE